MRIIKIYFILLLTFLPCTSYTIGLDVSIGTVLIENLQINEQYDLKEAVNLPYTVLNSCDESVKLEYRIVPSDKGIKKGFLPIPDVSWITLENTSGLLDPKASFSGNILIRIPDHNSLRGKKFCFDIIVQANAVESVRAVTMNIEITSHIYFTISKEEKMEIINNNTNTFSGDFSLEPWELYFTDQDADYIEIKNQSEKNTKLYIQHLNPAVTVFTVPDGHIIDAKKEFIKFSENEFELQPGQTKKISVTPLIPEQKEFKNKKFFYLFAVSSHKEEGGLRKYFRIYINNHN